MLLHCVVVKETRNWHIMPLNNATLLFFKRNDKNERLVYNLYNNFNYIFIYILYILFIIILIYINNQSGELTVIITNADNTSLSGFNKATKSYMLSKYSYECSIPN